MLLYRTQTQSLTAMRDVKRFSISKACLRLKSFLNFEQQQNCHCVLRLRNGKLINYSFRFAKKISVDILLRRSRISIPQLRGLKLSKEIDLWESPVRL